MYFLLHISNEYKQLQLEHNFDCPVAESSSLEENKEKVRKNHPPETKSFTTEKPVSIYLNFKGL
jgi:hypothetical protein